MDLHTAEVATIALFDAGGEPVLLPTSTGESRVAIDLAGNVVVANETGVHLVTGVAGLSPGFCV